MKHLKDGQNIQIERKSGRLKTMGITHKCYVFISGDDKNSVSPKNITAYGLQHASIITACDNSADLEEKKASVQIEDGEIVTIDNVRFKTILKGEYSDCVWFEEINYDGESKVISEYQRKGIA